MRIRALLLLALFGAVSLGFAPGQQVAATTSPKAPTGLSFAFDAPHGQLTASGFTVKAKPKVVGLSPTTGTIDITINIKIASKFHKETFFPCAAVVLGGEVDTTALTVSGGIETASGWASVNYKTGMATCTLRIPYEWTLIPDPSAAEGLVIVFAAAAVDEGGFTKRSTIQIGGAEALPANGATTTVAYSATL